MDGHPVNEPVGYLAIYQPAGSGYLSQDLPYVLQTARVGSVPVPVLSHVLKVEEETSRDPETSHLDETISILALGLADTAIFIPYHHLDQVFHKLSRGWWHTAR